jgi:cell division septation protein DedD
MANRRRGAAAQVPQITEGDEDVATRFRKGGVHLAAVDRKGTRTVSPGKRVAARDEGFVVRLGPYPSRRNAEAARDRLAKSGYRGRVVGQTIMVGQFPTRSSADRLAKGLRSKGYRPTIVAR